jgi:carboxypeptidase Q
VLQQNDMRAPLALFVSCTLIAGTALSQDDKPLQVVSQIKTEAFDHSQVMDTLENLTDLYGPRLTASPQFQQAADWAMERLKGYGVTNVHAEPWGPFGRSWSLEHYELAMTSPRYSNLIAAPLAWSSSTQGVQKGDAIYAPIHAPSNRYDMKKQDQALEDYEREWKGKLKGKVVLITDSKTPDPTTKPLFRRYTDAELATISEAPEPSIKRTITFDQLQVPEDPQEAREYLNSLPESVLDKFFDKFDDLRAKKAKFFHDEGVIGVVTADQRAHNGLIFAENAGPWQAKHPMAPPTFNRYSRAVFANHPVACEEADRLHAVGR